MKKVFLTGASSGIGLAIARELTQRGHEVWGTARDPRRIPQMPGLHSVALDLADEHSVRSSFLDALGSAGHFDVVINNAGSGYFGPAESLSSEVLRDQLQVLVVAQIELCGLALETMSKRESGLIINVSSLASRLPVPFMSAYNAAKAAMASFTMTLQLELRMANIHVVDLQPGDICTGFNDSVSKTETADARVAVALEQAWEVVEQNIKRAPKPELVARAVQQLIDQANPPARVTVGSTFQAIVAPLIFRLLPQRVRIWGLRKYYGI